MEQKENTRTRTESESEYEIRNPFKNFAFSNYLQEEVFQSFRRHKETENEQNSGFFRNRVNKFLSIPRYLESFIAYGLLQCLDHILLVYTFLPIRCMLTFTQIISFCVQSLLGCFISSFNKRKPFQLHPADARNIVKFSFVIICTLFVYTFDSSVAYHEIRTQSLVKIYIFFNLLEVADRLLSVICLDAIDDVLFTTTTCFKSKPLIKFNSDEIAPSSTCGAFVLQYIFALFCLSAHCLLLLAQVTTLNVAFNSQNRSLLTVMISNNFVELKSNVFRKMVKSNLFQIACADVRERFHYMVWLFIIVCRNMSATGWQTDDFLALLPDIVLIFTAEIAVDWVKHAFISKFNDIDPSVYEEYMVSIAYDLLLSRQGKNSSDYFELLARRMGLTPISLSCLINVMLIQTARSAWIFLVILVAIPLLFLIKVIVHLLLLYRAYVHVHAYTVMMTSKLNADLRTGDATASDETVKKPSKPSIKKTNRGQCTAFWPFTDNDQPPRDEILLAMPKISVHRRGNSDSACYAVPYIAEDGTLRTVSMVDKHYSDQSSMKESGELTDIGFVNSDQHIDQLTNISKVSSDHLSTKDNSTNLHLSSIYQHLFVDTSDMEIRNRKVPVNSLSQTNSPTGVLDSIIPTATNEDRIFHSSPNVKDHVETFARTFPLPANLRSTYSRSQNQTHLRRCTSLENGLGSSCPVQIFKASIPNTRMGSQNKTNIGFPISFRRRIHTDTELSSVSCLFELQSLLNNTSVFLEDVLSDSSDSDKNNTSKNSPETVKTFNSSDSMCDQVKQPLSHVDRYSMLGGQIS